MNAYESRLWWAVQPHWHWRLLRLVLRSFWISAGVAVGGWYLTARLGWPVPLLAWAAGGFSLFVALAATLVLWPIARQPLARRLDRAFDLRDRLTTATEVARRGPGNYLEASLLTSAGRLLTGVRAGLLKRPRVPWGDLELSLLALLLLLAVALGAIAPPSPPTVPPGANVSLPPLDVEPPISLPGLAPGERDTPAPFEAPAEDGQPEGPGQAEAQQAFDALTRALSENTITQRAGAALAQGDSQQAASILRDLAAAADSISPQARQQLADSLERAADSTQSAAPNESQIMRDAASGLRDTGPTAGQSAASALEELARLAESLNEARASGNEGQGSQGGDTGGDGASEGQGDAGREQQSAGSVERLQDEGQAFELPESDPLEDSVLQPPQYSGEAAQQGDTPYSQGAARGAGGDQPADRLSLPWRLRDVIQRYFSPP